MSPRRNLLLSGGPSHAFDRTSPRVAALLDKEGIASTIVDDPGVALGCLAAGDWDLFTVNALWWRMLADRYADRRDDWAFTIDADGEQALQRHVDAGGGLLALHTAVICFDPSPVWRDLLGGVWDWERSSHPPHGPLDVMPTSAGATHPVTTDLGAFSVADEAYCDLDLLDDVVPLATTRHGGRDHPLVWARTVGAGRVAVDLLGHAPESFEHPAHTALVRAAARWAVRGGR